MTGATDNNLSRGATLRNHSMFIMHHGCHVHTSTLVDLSPRLGATNNCVNVYVAP
jgi:hypothetical protein